MHLRFAFAPLFAVLAVTSVSHASPAHLWSQSYGDNLDQYPVSVIADPFGNIVLCGTFYGTVDITTPITSVGDRDIIIAKFQPDGTPMWSQRIGFPGGDYGGAATSDVVGNTIVVGAVGPAPGSRRGVLARYSPTGTQQWIKYFVSSDSLVSVDVVDTDPGKNIYVAGRFNGSMNIGGATLDAMNPYDLFIAKFGAGGNHIWSKSFNNACIWPEIAGICTDQWGQPTLFADFTDWVDFGGGVLTWQSFNDLCIAKFTTNGTHLWSRQFGLTEYHLAGAMALDPSGRIAITGETFGTIDLGGGVFSAASLDCYLALYDADGSHLWSKKFGAGDQETGMSVSFASNNDVLLGVEGWGSTPFSFGGPPVSGQATFFDFHVARFFVANGDYRWNARFYGTGGNTRGLVAEAGGQLVLAGQMTAPVDFGGGSLTASGGEDIYVARFADHLTGAGALPSRASLGQNVPNPFNPTTRIEYSLSVPARAVIEIHDARGALVARLDEGVRAAGAHTATWNGRDTDGRVVASGVYFYHLAGMPDVPAKKMVLLK